MALALKRPPRFAARDYRRLVSIPATLLMVDERVLPVTVRNLSPHGFMGLCDAQLGAGDWLGVDLPGFGIVRAMVRWTDDGEIGCRFRMAFDVERYAAALPAADWPRSPFAE